MYSLYDVTHTHTPRVAGFDFLDEQRSKSWQDYSNTKTFPGANVQSRVQSLRREVRPSLKCLDRVTEAHVIKHPPCVVDYPRCHSSPQSDGKLLGQVLNLRSKVGCLRRCRGLNGDVMKRMMAM